MNAGKLRQLKKLQHAVMIRDQAKLSDIEARAQKLRDQIVALQQSHTASYQEDYTVDEALCAEQYRIWLARKIAHHCCTLEQIQPHIDQARAQLKTSFGRHEALQRLIEKP